MLVMERWQSWSIASDLKSDEVQASVGSNPTFSDCNFIVTMWIDYIRIIRRIISYYISGKKNWRIKNQFDF